MSQRFRNHAINLFPTSHRNQSLPPRFPIPLWKASYTVKGTLIKINSKRGSIFLDGALQNSRNTIPVAILIFQSLGRAGCETVQQSTQLNYQPCGMPKSFHLVIDQIKVWRAKTADKEDGWRRKKKRQGKLRWFGMYGIK